MSSKDRPAGMDSLKMNYPKPNEKSRPFKPGMDAFRKAMSGKVDSGQRSRGVKMPKGTDKS